MAVSDSKLISLQSGATFAEADLYKAVGVSSTGGAVLYSAAAGATGGAGVIGTLYGIGSTDVGTAVEIGVAQS